MTGQQVFEQAMVLMDSGDPMTGEVSAKANGGYRKRSLGILRLLLRECGDLGAEKEPRKALEPEDLEEELGLPEEICASALSYGLAAHLLMEEDPAAANFFQQRYEERVKAYKRKQAKIEPIELPWGGIEMGEDGRWNMWR